MLAKTVKLTLPWTFSVRALERYSATSQFTAKAGTQPPFSYSNAPAVSESSEEEEANHPRRKRLKVAADS